MPLPVVVARTLRPAAVAAVAAHSLRQVVVAAAVCSHLPEAVEVVAAACNLRPAAVAVARCLRLTGAVAVARPTSISS